ncbi:uncharacterized protein LOC119452363 [Dermacentor silvarum]|uniref:uncharacterized protein LOC119452363 n=1 Tax=Dermacentor silvarum TaxID=543639 RepID=UPI0021017813|nr:uncharacterized protein LOC119452363 [Dermacentor silvarum]
MPHRKPSGVLSTSRGQRHVRSNAASTTGPGSHRLTTPGVSTVDVQPRPRKEPAAVLIYGSSRLLGDARTQRLRHFLSAAVSPFMDTGPAAYSEMPGHSAFVTSCQRPYRLLWTRAAGIHRGFGRRCRRRNNRKECPRRRIPVRGPRSHCPSVNASTRTDFGARPRILRMHWRTVD